MRDKQPMFATVQARARFRDYDGVRRPVTRWGSHEGEASCRLLTALRGRAFFPEGEIAPGTRLSAAARVWLAEVDRSPLAAGTKQLYRAAARIYLGPTLGEVPGRAERRDHRACVCLDPVASQRAVGAGRAAGAVEPVSDGGRNPTGLKLDLPDFVEFMLGTGLRIGEAAAVRVAVLDVDAGPYTSTPRRSV